MTARTVRSPKTMLSKCGIIVVPSTHRHKLPMTTLTQIGIIQTHRNSATIAKDHAYQMCGIIGFFADCLTTTLSKCYGIIVTSLTRVPGLPRPCYQNAHGLDCYPNSARMSFRQRCRIRKVSLVRWIIQMQAVRWLRGFVACKCFFEPERQHTALVYAKDC